MIKNSLSVSIYRNGIEDINYSFKHKMHFVFDNADEKKKFINKLKKVAKKEGAIGFESYTSCGFHNVCEKLNCYPFKRVIGREKDYHTRLKIYF